MAILALWSQGGQPGRAAWRVADPPGPPYGPCPTLGASEPGDELCGGRQKWPQFGLTQELDEKPERNWVWGWNDPRTGLTPGDSELTLSLGYNHGW